MCASGGHRRGGEGRGARAPRGWVSQLALPCISGAPSPPPCLLFSQATTARSRSGRAPSAPPAASRTPRWARPRAPGSGACAAPCARRPCPARAREQQGVCIRLKGQQDGMYAAAAHVLAAVQAGQAAQAHATAAHKPFPHVPVVPRTPPLPLSPPLCPSPRPPSPSPPPPSHRGAQAPPFPPFCPPLPLCPPRVPRTSMHDSWSYCCGRYGSDMGSQMSASMPLRMPYSLPRCAATGACPLICRAVGGGARGRMCAHVRPRLHAHACAPTHQHPARNQ